MKSLLKLVVPSKIEEFFLNLKVKRFVKKLRSCLKEGEIFIGGSFAKGTWLKGNYDIDIFVMFDYDFRISDELEEYLKKAFRNAERIHGSRDYFQVPYYNLIFEVIPILKISKANEANNITDISPLHVEWVKKHAKKNLCNEIRLSKAFCKAQGVYGAETFIKGFSGYALEILTIYYGSFKNLLKSSQSWRRFQIIDISKHFKKLNESKKSPLIVIDPVQHDRNAAAALSLEKFKKFKMAAKGFLSNPDEAFFKKRGVKLKDLKNKDLVLKIIPEKGKKDIVGTKILKVFEFIRKKINLGGYGIKKCDWSWNKDCFLWFELKTKELPKFKKHFGPPIDKDIYVRDFKLKYRKYKIYEEKGRLFVNLPRKITKIKPFIEELLKDPKIKEKVSSIKIVR